MYYNMMNFIDFCALYFYAGRQVLYGVSIPGRLQQIRDVQ